MRRIPLRALKSMALCDQLKLIPAKLVLQSGEVYEGSAPEWCAADTFGEVVFTTGMMGYVESLTDPSYAGQILTFTFPLIGNYGVPDQKEWESSQIHARGAIFSEISPFCDHYQAMRTLAAWLREQNVPFLCGVDTRSLTKSLRMQGVAPGAIVTGKSIPRSFPDPNQTHLVASVSTKHVRKYEPIVKLHDSGKSTILTHSCQNRHAGSCSGSENILEQVGELTLRQGAAKGRFSASKGLAIGSLGKGKKTIIAVDCGMKENILRSLLKFPVQIKQVPYDYDYSEEECDGIFISNGPGDPTMCKETIAVLQKALKRKIPIFGICLGAQLLSLSIGAKTYKLPYGHRGQNQPCEFLESGRCFLTSQNHGYAIDEKTLPKGWSTTFRNLNDGSVEGIAHRSLPFFAVQFHPEAAPGPVDTLWLFEQFYQLL